jgi:hypothetical protein
MKHPPAIGIVLLALLLTVAGSAHASGLVVKLGRSSVRLDGPWRFHIGDNPRWAHARFDDSSWRDMSFSAPRQ